MYAGFGENQLIGAWTFLTFGEDRQYGGNLGYEDDLQTVYKYDSKVPNHKQVGKGDVAVLRGKKDVLGIARIISIKKERGVKHLKRCPQCNTTSIRHRPSKNPPWRCDDGKHEFEEPTSTEIEVDLFEAGFGGTFVPLNDKLTVSMLREISLRRNDQLAIQRLDLGKLEYLVRGDPAADRLMLRAVAAPPFDVDGYAEDEGEFTPSMADQREKVLREIYMRRGQKKFRNQLLERFDGRCAISGCNIPELLEAAHILPYRGEEFNHPSNGLLLRTDLHTLFDWGVLLIDPETLEIWVDAKIKDPNYRKFHGKALVFVDGFPASTEALQMRWETRGEK